MSERMETEGRHRHRHRRRKSERTSDQQKKSEVHGHSDSFDDGEEFVVTKNEIAKAIKLYHKSLPDAPPGIITNPKEMPLSVFETIVYEKQIGKESQKIMAQFKKVIGSKKCEKNMHDLTLKEKPFRVIQTPAKWSEFVFQKKMNDVIQSLIIEMTSAIHKKFGSAFSVRSKQEHELKKEGLLGGKYRGYAFYVHYARDSVPSEVINVNF